MLDIVGGEDGEFDGAADTVVGAEGGSLSGEPFAIDVGLDGILVEVEHHVYEFVAHHIHVTLQDHGLAVLHARGGRFADDHVACLIDIGVKAVGFTPVLEVFNHLFLALRRAGNFVNHKMLTFAAELQRKITKND